MVYLYISYLNTLLLSIKLSRVNTTHINIIFSNLTHYILINMAISIESYLPKSQEEFWEIFQHPTAQRAKDYIEEVWPLEYLMISLDGTYNETIVHATCLYWFLETKHVTGGGDPSTADEIAMEGLTQYIDSKVEGIVNYDRRKHQMAAI